MKKFLLFCTVGISFTLSAQYNHTEDFSDVSDNNDSFAFFGSGAAISTTVFCSGPQAFAQTYSASAASGGPFTDFSHLAQTNNGQRVSVSVNYQKGNSVAGTLYLIYAEYNATAGSWSLKSIASKTLSADAVTSCTAFSTTIPAGTLDPAKSYGIGAYFVRSAGSGTVYFDDLAIKQDVVTTSPACTTITAPANAGTANYGNTNISWSATPTATAYKISLGTSSGASDIYSTTVGANILSQSVPTKPNQSYFARVIPSNVIGDATGCQEINFNTNATLQYCTAAASGSSAASYEYITNVTFGAINNTSARNEAVGYTDYSATQKTDVAIGAQNLPLSVQATIDGSDYLTAFFDWNHDGAFAASEAVVLTSDNNTPGSQTFTANVSVPADAIVAATKMRVVMKYDAAPTGCDGTFSYGEVEDYTVNIAGPTLGVTDASKQKLTIYPNPFHDIVKISDVSGVKEVLVNDMTGRLVQTLPATADVKLSQLKNGMYIISLKMKDGSVKAIQAIKK